MGEDSAHADRSATTLSGPASSEPISTTLPGATSSELSSTLPGSSSSEPISTTMPGSSSSEMISTTLPGSSSSEPISTTLPGSSSSEPITTLPGSSSSELSSTLPGPTISTTVPRPANSITLPGPTNTNRKSATLPVGINRLSAFLPGVGSTGASPDLEEEAQDILIPSFSHGSTPTSPVHTLTRGSKSASSAPGQVSAITVVALLDKLVAMIEAVQANQQRMEKRQVELEGVVRGVQGDVTRLAKNHMSTSNSVAKLLERSRKTSGYIKEVRERLERQSTQVKRLEANHAHLLKRNHFKVIIFQEDNEIPATLLTKGSTADLAELISTSPQNEIPASPPATAADGNTSQEEGLQTISLSSDEDEGAASPPAEGSTEPQLEEEEELPGLGAERCERSRADKFKRSSLKRVDSLKKAFSRSSIEKKINKIVPPERREKIKKSFTPNHPKSPTSKSSSFHVSPMTFNVKKIRDGDGEGPPCTRTALEVPSIGESEAQLPVAEIHIQEEQVNGQPVGNPSPGSTDGAVLTAEEGELEVGPSTALTEDKPLQQNGDGGEGVEQENSPAATPPPTASVAIQAS